MKWYFGNVTKRTQAKRYLLEQRNGPGSFLVWKKAKNSFYYLSVKCDGIAWHYKITEDDKSFYLVERKKFLSVSELVDSYSRDPDGLCEQLNKPCAKVEISPPLVCKGKEWEIERSSLEKVEKLDSGEFGEVWKGIWKNKTEVAIKEFPVRNKNILNEIEILKQLKHRRLLKLYGVCTMDDPISIVTELLNGSLSRFLRKGMAYLEAKKILHRDLRAENILLVEFESCKIADFGLAQFTVSGENAIEMDAKLPVKWMAPEVFTSQKYTVKCDVWSFGILLTEIITSGEEPYSDKSKASCVKAIKNGYRMPKPPDCPQSLYDIMLICWSSNPLERPGFINLKDKLSEVQKPLIPM
ncbi:tyrosine-protein kinase Src42A-like [Scleropages formosus]|uniref:Tyrosine-protein kinase n=1 Tax=Scleropages formosus TaxID=113540 RepID=A0A0P7U1J2_SCLFO|nr:tyrosine-protein kinase Src42A-like [Scleropages formosus]